MRSSFHFALAAVLLASGCTGARLSHDEVRKQISELGTSTLVPNAIQVRRVASQSATRAIAETTVELTFQFERDTAGSPWHVAAVRLGDRDWVSVPELLAAVNEGRKRETADSLKKLADGIVSYRQKNGASPNVTDIVSLTDVLHPSYMPDLVRLDAWGHPIQYTANGAAYQLRSAGPDGLNGTPDDILLPE